MLMAMSRGCVGDTGGCFSHWHTTNKTAVIWDINTLWLGRRRLHCTYLPEATGNIKVVKYDSFVQVSCVPCMYKIVCLSEVLVVF